MSLPLFLLVVILLVAVFPAWPYSNGWSYYPAGGVGLVLILLLIMILLGRW